MIPLFSQIRGSDVELGFHNQKSSWSCPGRVSINIAQTSDYDVVYVVVESSSRVWLSQPAAWLLSLMPVTITTYYARPRTIPDLPHHATDN